MQIPDEKERDLRKAMAALCDLARTNFPRSTDLTLKIDAGPVSSGCVNIPVWLLSKLLEPKEPSEKGRE